jgi:glycine/D-amino acid oxidase-like deaminating enzyme
VALKLASYGQKVLLLEAEDRLLGRASFINQARIHGGYHYPRSFLTAKRSRANYRLFKERFSHAVVDSFTHYYAIAASLSKVDARQFVEFCRRIEAPLTVAPAEVRRLFSRDLVEEVFEAEECVFDASRLRQESEAALDRSGVKWECQSRVSAILPHAEEPFEVARQNQSSVVAREVWVCAYSGLNGVLQSAGAEPIPLRLERAEMALVELPDALKGRGVTVMDGPFFSLLPFPAFQLHTLSHVRYTPHLTWEEGPGEFSGERRSDERLTHFEAMRRDSARYLPAVAGCSYVRSIWETKALLPRSEENDSRPILFRLHYGFPRLHCVLGGKLDNVFDALDEIDAYYQKSVP